jgi:hypothetical protein
MPGERKTVYAPEKSDYGTSQARLCLFLSVNRQEDCPVFAARLLSNPKREAMAPGL